MKIQKHAFTLVEVLVAITIFSIMMITVMGVYMTSTEITYKADLNRFMQENVKNMITNLSEDVMQYGVEGVKKQIWTNYNAKEGFALRTNGSNYTIHRYDTETKTDLGEVDVFSWKCKPLATGSRPHCILYKNDTPVTNDLVTIENIKYRLAGGTDSEGNNIPQKLTVFVTLAIAPRSGVREGLVKETKLHTQFTISVRNWVGK